MRGRLATALLIWSAWTALAVFFALTSSLTYVSQGRPAIWGLSLAYSLGQWWIWALLTPVVFWFATRWPLTLRALVTRVPLHFALGLVVAFVKVKTEGWVRQWLFGVSPYLLINNLALQVLIYWALVGIAHALDTYGRSRQQAAEIQARLGRAKLELLRAQLQPHFLFNSLNVIAELVHEDPDRADRMIGRLSHLLRSTLEAGDRPLVTLDEEIGIVESYVRLQEERFGDRLSVRIDVAPECRAALVPHFVLQPIVENAIQHGVAPKAGGATIHLTAARGPRGLELRIADDGAGIAEAAKPGIGIANTRGRLESLYGGAASFELAGKAGGGAVATIVIPLSTGAPEASRS
jgi:two-component system, LytTR family, sensor kinase